MKTLKIYITVLFASLFMGSNALAQDNTPADNGKKKGWSKKAKGAVVGGVGGAAAGRVIAGKRGGTRAAILGGAAGAAAGGAIGRKKDRKKDPVRYDQYADKKD